MNNIIVRSVRSALCIFALVIAPHALAAGTSTPVATTSETTSTPSPKGPLKYDPIIFPPGS